MVASPKRKCEKHFLTRGSEPAQALVLHSDALVRIFVLVLAYMFLRSYTMLLHSLLISFIA